MVLSLSLSLSLSLFLSRSILCLSSSRSINQSITFEGIEKRIIENGEASVSSLDPSEIVLPYLVVVFIRKVWSGHHVRNYIIT